MGWMPWVGDPGPSPVGHRKERNVHGSGIRRVFALAVTAMMLFTACSSSATTAPTAAPANPTQAAAGTAAAGTSAAPAATAAPELSGEISILEKYSDPKYAPYWEKVVKDYMTAHPKVKIDLQAEGDQPVKDKLRVLTASGNLPDIYFSWAGDFAAKFVRGGFAADLTDAVMKTDWKNSYLPATLDALSYDGKLYAVPITLDAKVMAYNKQLFADNGVQVPSTMAQLLQVCDTLKGKGIEPIAFGNTYGWPAVHYLTQLNYYYVPAATLAKDYNPATGEFTDPGYVQALQAFADINTHCLTPKSNGITHENAQAEFLNGKAAMQYVETVEFGLLTDVNQGAPEGFADKMSFFKLPAPEGAAGDASYLEGAPDSFMVNSKTQHMDVVLDFLKYVSSKPVAAEMTQMLGWLAPVVGSASADNTFPQNIQVLDEINKAKGMAIWLDTVTQIDVANAYLNGLQAMLDGSKTPADVMKDVQAAAVKAKASVSQ